MKFKTTVRAAGKTATGLPVPDAIVEKLGAGKRPKVTVTVGGHSYASSIASMGGEYMLPLSAANRAAAGVSAGDTVQVDVVLDTAERSVTVPPDLAKALKADPAARTFFEGLSYSQQSWHVLALEGAKKPETRARRLEKSMEMLREGRKV